jgi:hypothetical protein
MLVEMGAIPLFTDIVISCLHFQQEVATAIEEERLVLPMGTYQHEALRHRLYAFASHIGVGREAVQLFVNPNGCGQLFWRVVNLLAQDKEAAKQLMKCGLLAPLLSLAFAPPAHPLIPGLPNFLPDSYRNEAYVQVGRSMLQAIPTLIRSACEDTALQEAELSAFMKAIPHVLALLRSGLQSTTQHQRFPPSDLLRVVDAGMVCAPDGHAVAEVAAVLIPTLTNIVLEVQRAIQAQAEAVYFQPAALAFDVRPVWELICSLAASRNTAVKSLLVDAISAIAAGQPSGRTTDNRCSSTDNLATLLRHPVLVAPCKFLTFLCRDHAPSKGALLRSADALSCIVGCMGDILQEDARIELNSNPHPSFPIYAAYRSLEQQQARKAAAAGVLRVLSIAPTIAPADAEPASKPGKEHTRTLYLLAGSTAVMNALATACADQKQLKAMEPAVEEEGKADDWFWEGYVQSEGLSQATMMPLFLSDLRAAQKRLKLSQCAFDGWASAAAQARGRDGKRARR